MAVASMLLAAVLAASRPEGVVLHDGREIAAPVAGLDASGLRLDGQPEPIPLHELNAIRLAASEADGKPDPLGEDLSAGPLVSFRGEESSRGGELARALVVKAGEREATIRLDAPGGSGRPAIELSVPLEDVAGFRLDAATEGDPVFETDLRDGPPSVRGRAGEGRSGEARSGEEPSAGGNVPAGPSTVPVDTVYVRRPTGILRAEGRFRSLDESFLTITMDGAARRVRRDIVVGVILAPMASSALETEIPAVIETDGLGRLPAYLVAIDGAPPERKVSFRFPGARVSEAQSLPESWVRGIRLSSDRVVFLSELGPAVVEEVPLLGERFPFPWKKDLASSGGPIRLGGRRYSRGLGVHPYCALEFQLEGRYRALAGTIGLDDASGADSGVTFRVLADGKEIYAKDILRKTQSSTGPEGLSLPMDGVKRLRLEVDYGPDGVDFGDHADWADLRVTR